MICFICGGTIRDDDYEMLEDGEPVCQDCAVQFCQRCERCGNLFEESTMTEINGEYFCEDCMEDEEEDESEDE